MRWARSRASASQQWMTRSSACTACWRRSCATTPARALTPSAVKRALAALEHAFPADPSDAAGWPRSEQLLAHVIALADAAAGVPDTAEQVIELLNRACLYLIWAEGGARGLALAQSTVKRATSSLGAEHPSTLTARNREAFAYHQTGRASQAIALFRSCSPTRSGSSAPSTPTRSTHPPRPRRAPTRTAGRVAEAIAIYEPLLADQRADPRHRAPQHAQPPATTPPPPTRTPGASAEAIAILRAARPDTRADPRRRAPRHAHHPQQPRRRLPGRRAHREAIAIFQPLLADHERILGAEHPDTLSHPPQPRLAYRDAGRIAEAIAIYEPLLADRERILGAEHPDTLSTRHNLAFAYRAAGRARRRSRSTSRCSPTASGSSAPSTPTRSPPATASPPPTWRPGAWRRRSRFLSAARRPRADPRPTHPSTLNTRNNLAVAYRAAGREEDAAALQGGRSEGDAR